MRLKSLTYNITTKAKIKKVLNVLKAKCHCEQF